MDEIGYHRTAGEASDRRVEHGQLTIREIARGMFGRTFPSGRAAHHKFTAMDSIPWNIVPSAAAACNRQPKSPRASYPRQRHTAIIHATTPRGAQGRKGVDFAKQVRTGLENRATSDPTAFHRNEMLLRSLQQNLEGVSESADLLRWHLTSPCSPPICNADSGHCTRGSSLGDEVFVSEFRCGPINELVKLVSTPALVV
jgi:hypothetical protein